MYSFSVVVAIVTLASSISGGHGCSCDTRGVAQTVNNYLHKSLNVMRVKLMKDVTPTPDANATDTLVDWHYFEGKVMKAVKGNITTGDSVIVKDASDGGRCGLGLTAGRVWLLSGTFDNGANAADMPMFSPQPCMSHNIRWSYTSAWERELVEGYSPSRGLCYKKDCIGPVDSPQPCPDGVSLSSTKKVCRLMGESCGYTTTAVTACPAVNCTSNGDCLNGSHCASTGLCEF